MMVWRQLGFLVGFAALYAVALVFSDTLAVNDRFGIAPIWPPAGIGLACLLLGGVRAWPAIAVGYLAGQLLSVSIPAIFLVFAFAANVVAPVVAVTLVRRYWPNQLLRIHLRNGLVIFLTGAALALMSSTLGTAGGYFSGLVASGDLLAFGTEWFLGDVFGVVVCTPALLAAGRGLRFSRLAAEDDAFYRYAEKVVWLLMAAAGAWLWLWLSEKSPAYALAVTFLPFTLLGWSALRFDYLFSTIAIGAMTLAVAACIQQGVGGFEPPETALDKAVLMFFLSFMAVLPQLVAAASHQNRYYERKLRFRAHHDPLTGLPNRVAFEDEAAEAVAQAAQTGETAGLFYLDLDSFKVVNDTCGHTAGDELLKQFAHVLASNNHPGDTIARLGGDEFGFIFRGVDAAQAETRARSLIQAIDQFRFVWRKNIFAFTASGGLALIDRHSAEVGKVLSAADTACYDAKQKGGNRVSLAHGAADSAHRSTAMHWAVRITKALERNRFELYCQPIARLDGGDELPVHFEVLLRLTGKDGKNMPPGIFIPAAESFNLMPRVDRWVVRNTLGYLRRHPVSLGQVGTCSINLSGKTLGDPTFLEELVERLKGSSVPCEKLCFEVTETSAIGDLRSATRFIETLRDLGCRFALDDFGSGLSSFGYLKSLAVDYIKIDGVFIRDLAVDSMDTAVVRAITEVGHVLGKQVIAEYVETDEVIQRLREIGVDLAQGHAFGKPMPLERYFEELEIRLESAAEGARQSG